MNANSKSQLMRRHIQRGGCQCDACMVNVRGGLMPHASDCHVHNAPAYPMGPCNCGADELRAPPSQVRSEEQ